MFNRKYKEKIAALEKEIEGLKEKPEFSYKKRKLSAKQKFDLWNSVVQKDYTQFTVQSGGVAMDAMDVFDSLAKDGIKRAFSYNGRLDDFFYSFYGKYGFIGYQACALLMNHWLISRICTLPVEDALSAGFSLKIEDSGDKEKEKDKKDDILNELCQKAVEYKLDDAVRRHCINTAVYGVSYALPIIDGIDYTSPFNIDGVKRGSYHGMKIIDPVWVLPEFNQAAVTNPASLDFYEPTYYRLMNGEYIHKSHLIKCNYAPVGDVLKPSYFFGGVPLTQMLYRPVYDAEKIAEEVAPLVASKRLLVVDGDMESYIADQEEMQQRLEAIADLRDNDKIVFKNPDDSVSQIDTSLTDLPEVQVKAYQRVCAVGGVPYEKVMATNPSGSNASGEYTSRQYAQTLNVIQQNRALPVYQRHFELSNKSDFGETFDIGVVFNPIDSPTAIETAQNAAIKVNTLATGVQTGALSPEDMRQSMLAMDSLGLSSLPEEMEIPETENPFEVGKTESGQVREKSAGQTQGTHSVTSDPKRYTMPVDPKTQTRESFKLRGKGALPSNKKE